jgi:hypothetical protein
MTPRRGRTIIRIDWRLDKLAALTVFTGASAI